MQTGEKLGGKRGVARRMRHVGKEKKERKGEGKGRISS